MGLDPLLCCVLLDLFRLHRPTGQYRFQEEAYIGSLWLGFLATCYRLICGYGHWRRIPDNTRRKDDLPRFCIVPPESFFNLVGECWGYSLRSCTDSCCCE